MADNWVQVERAAEDAVADREQAGKTSQEMLFSGLTEQMGRLGN
jgi:hypothetical protein